MPLLTHVSTTDAEARPSHAAVDRLVPRLPWAEVIQGLGVAFLVIASLCVIVGFLALPVAPLP